MGAQREITFIHVVLDLLSLESEFFDEFLLLLDLLVDLFQFI